MLLESKFFRKVGVTMNNLCNPSLKQYINKLRNNHHLSFKHDNLVAINKHFKTYNSIQIISEPSETNPLEVADNYFKWIASTSRGLIRVQNQEDTYELYFCLINKPLLTLTLKKTDDVIAVFLVSGELLAKQNQKGTFSFLRSESNKSEIIIALEQFETRLPWFLYRMTQAPIYEIVMSQYQNKKNAKAFFYKR